MKGARAGKSNALLQDYCMLEAVKSDMAYYVMASSEDLSMRIKVSCPSVAEDGKMLIAWDTISVLASLNKETQISVSAKMWEDGRGFDATYQWKGTCLNLPIDTNPDEYPVNGAWVNAGPTMAIGATEFRDGLRAVSFAMSKDEARQIMCATWVHHDGTDLEFAACDLQVLAIRTYMGQGTLDGCDESTVVIPTRAVALAQGMRGDGIVTLETDKTDYRIYGNDVEIRWKAVAGKVPDYASIVPKSKNTACELRISPADMAGCLRRVTMLTSAGHLKFKWELCSDTAEVASNDAMIAYSERFKCEGKEVNGGMKGQPVIIGFKSSNLLAVLNNCKSDSLVLRFMDSRRAVCITKDTDTEDIVDRYVVMPISINTGAAKVAPEEEQEEQEVAEVAPEESTEQDAEVQEDVTDMDDELDSEEEDWGDEDNAEEGVAA